MSIKKQLLAEIQKKANKIKEKRIDAANNKTIESAVFDFFKNVETSKALGKNGYDEFLFSNAKSSLIQRLKVFDNNIKVSVEFNITEPDQEFKLENSQVRGVTLWWSASYIAKNSVDPSLYIDVSEMLFL